MYLIYRSENEGERKERMVYFIGKEDEFSQS